MVTSGTNASEDTNVRTLVLASGLYKTDDIASAEAMGALDPASPATRETMLVSPYHLPPPMSHRHNTG
jgi:hypothetical protein